VLVLFDRRAEAVEEQLHRLGVHVGQDQREGVVGAGLDRGEDVGEREALVGDAAWAFAALPPDMAGAAFLADPRLVLEEDADALFCPLTD
jgi:hypothetical protein